MTMATVVVVEDGEVHGRVARVTGSERVGYNSRTFSALVGVWRHACDHCNVRRLGLWIKVLVHSKIASLVKVHLYERRQKRCSD